MDPDLWILNCGTCISRQCSSHQIRLENSGDHHLSLLLQGPALHASKMDGMLRKFVAAIELDPLRREAVRSGKINGTATLDKCQYTPTFLEIMQLTWDRNA